MATPVAAPKRAAQERIVHAAAQLFSRQGFNGTTTREIARLADVNETTLFRHFSTKQELFWASLESRISLVAMRRELRAALVNGDYPVVVLPMLIEFLVDMVLYQPELARLMYFSVLELKAGAEALCRERVGPLFEIIRAYLQRCVDNQTVRQVDPAIAVAALAASILAHQGLYRLVTGNALPFRSADEAIGAYAKFWTAALLPPASSLQRASKESL